nr:pistil-specific extensin-like protein [Aegilops tauschii subsp. strangulata]
MAAALLLNLAPATAATSPLHRAPLDPALTRCPAKSMEPPCPLLLLLPATPSRLPSLESVQIRQVPPFAVAMELVGIVLVPSQPRRRLPPCCGLLCSHAPGQHLSKAQLALPAPSLSINWAEAHDTLETYHAPTVPPPQRYTAPLAAPQQPGLLPLPNGPPAPPAEQRRGGHRGGQQQKPQGTGPPRQQQQQQFQVPPPWASGYNPWTGVVHAYTMPVSRAPALTLLVSRPPAHQVYYAAPQPYGGYPLPQLTMATVSLRPRRRPRRPCHRHPGIRRLRCIPRLRRTTTLEAVIESR